MFNRNLRDIVGFDLDSVIANTDYALDRYIRTEFGISLDWDNIYEYKIENFPELTDEMKSQTLNDIHNGVILFDIEPYDSIIEDLKNLRSEGINLFIVTSRPANLFPMTSKWLKENDIMYDGLFFTESSKKYEVVKACGLKCFVEDRDDILESIYTNCGELVYGSYLVDHPWNRLCSNPCISRVSNASEVVERILHRRGDYYVKGEM